MRRRFLCPQHTAWLTIKPQMAMKIWAESIDNGITHYECRSWHAALPQFGCAYETAEILLRHGSLSVSTAVERFVTTAILLINCCARMGRSEMAEQFLGATVKRLTSLENIWGMETEILEAKHQLQFACDESAVSEILQIRLAYLSERRFSTLH